MNEIEKIDEEDFRKFRLMGLFWEACNNIKFIASGTDRGVLLPMIFYTDKNNIFIYSLTDGFERHIGSDMTPQWLKKIIKSLLEKNLIIPTEEGYLINIPILEKYAEVNLESLTMEELEKREHYF